jgi:hypothetical protein
MTARLRLAGTSLAALLALPLAAMAADTPAAADATVAAAASAVTMASNCPGDAGLSTLERRLLAKYDQDVNYLMQYVWTTRMIHQLDRAQTAEWAWNYRRTHPAC